MNVLALTMGYIHYSETGGAHYFRVVFQWRLLRVVQVFIALFLSSEPTKSGNKGITKQVVSCLP